METDSIFLSLFTIIFVLIVLGIFFLFVHTFVHKFVLARKGIQSHNLHLINKLFGQCHFTGIINGKLHIAISKLYDLSEIDDILEKKSEIPDDFYLSPYTFKHSSNFFRLGFYSFKGIFKTRLKKLVKLIIFYDYRLNHLRVHCLYEILDRVEQDPFNLNEIVSIYKYKIKNTEICLDLDFGQDYYNIYYIDTDYKILKEIRECMFIQNYLFEKLIKLLHNKNSSIPIFFEIFDEYLPDR